jgi:hypothetical protein
MAQRSHWAKLFSRQFDATHLQAVRTIGLTNYKI